MEIFFTQRKCKETLRHTCFNIEPRTYSPVIIAALLENWSKSISQIHFIFNKSLALLQTPALCWAFCTRKGVGGSPCGMVLKLPVNLSRWKDTHHHALQLEPDQHWKENKTSDKKINVSQFQQLKRKKCFYKCNELRVIRGLISLWIIRMICKKNFNGKIIIFLIYMCVWY